MSVPSFYRFLRPTLAVLSDGRERHWREVEAAVTESMGLPEEDLEELIPSGLRTRVADRVQWALTYLRQAGLAVSTGRGVTRITPLGQEYVERAPEVVRPSDLMEFPEFVEFKERTGQKRQESDEDADEDETPEERMATSFEEHEAALAEEVLEAVKSMTPARFERLIVQLMLAMGYGGAEDSGRTLGRSGDEGVDGVIDQDELGLEKVYLQAKKWTDATVGRKEVQAFIGALSGQGASKGVFITSSSFSREAHDYARNIKQFSLSLVDGIELARLMIGHDIGVTLRHTYDLKRVDSDFFSGE